MGTLLLRLAGPMQSWGTQSRFSIRDTGLKPSKSGVIGLLCAALGKPRDEAHSDNIGKPSLAQLTALRMGVRVNHEGVMQKDYHTAGGVNRRGEIYGVVKASGAKGDPVPSTRYYLADADFLVGLESENNELLRQLDRALAQPHWQLFLGRKSFVPALPVRLPRESDGSFFLLSLEEALRYDWPLDPTYKESKLRVVIEPKQSDPEAFEVRCDVPLSFARRQFSIRYVKTTWFEPEEGVESDGTRFE
ncbi:MAG: type I-E CRISPR-associated protein Cas5/CasD [Pyrinomonadaceae bacterium]